MTSFGETPDIEGELTRLLSGIDSMAEIQQSLAELTGSGEAHNGLLRVTVGPTGALTDITIDPRAMRLDSQSMRDGLLAAALAAQADVSTKVDELMSGLAPAGSGFGDFVTGQGSLSMPTTSGETTDDPIADMRRTIEQVRRDLL